MDAQRRPFRFDLISGVRRLRERFTPPPPRIPDRAVERDDEPDTAALLHEIRTRITRLAAEGSLTPGGGYFCGDIDEVREGARDIDDFLVALADLGTAESSCPVLRRLPAREAGRS